MNEYGEFVGVDSLYAAPVTTDTEAAYVAGTPEYLAPAAEIAGGAEVATKSTYYDNVPSDVYITEGATVMTITLKGIPARKAAYYLGKDYDEANGRVYDSGKPKPPIIALSFRYAKGPDDDYRYYQYLKGKFTGGSEEATSKSNDVTLKTYQMTFTAMSTVHKWTVNGVAKALKRIFADTTEDAFDPDGWFDEVQTPDTVAAPSAIALSTIVPADDAPNIAITAAVVITFNNKIASDSVTLISAAGALVTATKTYDITGKILTLTPASALSAGTTYIVAVNGVVDVYGQELAAVAKNFGTAS